MKVYNSTCFSSRRRNISSTPSFKAFIVTKKGKFTLNRMQQVLDTQPKNWLEELKLKNITECLKQIEEIKPFAETSKYFNLVFNGQKTGIYEFIIKSNNNVKMLSTLDDIYITETPDVAEDCNKIAIQMMQKEEIKRIRLRTNPNYLYNAFFKVFRILEENTQNKAKI